MTAVCVLLNRQIPPGQPAERHDPNNLYRTIVCAHWIVSDDNNYVVCAVSVRARVLITAVCACEINRHLNDNQLSGNVPAINAPALTTWYCLVFALSNLFSCYDLLLLRRCMTAVSCKTTAWCVFCLIHDFSLLSCLLLSLLRMNHHQGARTAVARRRSPPLPACPPRKLTLAYVLYIT